MGHRGPPCGEPRGPADPRPPPSLAGILHEDLRLLLETSMPAKKKKALLGVADAKIGAAILEELGYQCQTGGVVAEILRGEPGRRVGDREDTPVGSLLLLGGTYCHRCWPGAAGGDGCVPTQGSACTSTRW